jgi:hypothetical protein
MNKVFEAVAWGGESNSWLADAAEWSYQAVPQWILRVRPGYAGLRIGARIFYDWRGSPWSAPSLERITRSIFATQGHLHGCNKY